MLDITGNGFKDKAAAAEWLAINDPNRKRFMWHKRVLFDPELTFGALRLAGWIMHDYQAGRGNPVKLPLFKTAKILGIDKHTLVHARDLLVKRGWLVRINDNSKRTAIYLLGPGPNEEDEGVMETPSRVSRSHPSLIST